MARVSNLQQVSLLCCATAALCCCAALHAQDDDGIADERDNVTRSVDAAGVVTFVKSFRILTEVNGKKVPTTIMAVKAPLVLECRAWAQDAKVTEVIFQFLGAGEKVVASAKGVRRGETDFYEAKTTAPDVAGRMAFRVVVKAERTAPAEKPPDAATPPKPPNDEF